MTTGQVLALDPQIRQALVAPSEPAAARGDWKTRRDAAAGEFARINSLRPAPAGVTSSDHLAVSSDGAEIRMRWYTPQAAEADGTRTAAVAFLHGGSMILGSIDHYDQIVQHYVAASGVPTLAVDYRVAPEHPHPTPSEDCYAGLLWLAEHAGQLGVDAARIAVMGDSAGGALAAAVCLMARDRGGPWDCRAVAAVPHARRPPPASRSRTGRGHLHRRRQFHRMAGTARLGRRHRRSLPYAAPARARDVACFSRRST